MTANTAVPSRLAVVPMFDVRSQEIRSATHVYGSIEVLQATGSVMERRVALIHCR